ncbi:TetR/AcrR family transcriptional regulator [Modestobacter sp. VKM Ac-2984]|uniref:TetR/AcrR family transcriptional regulator n=1 Tax=Modestobacter sp. VKM Ac-2984 TaxID=3004138 RepID=UPI0022AA9CA1|nr:TetR family transcriptional regulator [Modestobacter sp. VKM Ac-2984]MCZ2816331.1 TetR family transcriptional regulator [Modestobacter sp. VKM Ac-2984]
MTAPPTVPPEPGRPDRSAAVKARIRGSARERFNRDGFEATGIRDIAADAGVNPALVIRHFRSKEHLFIETVGADASWGDVLDGPLDQIGARAVRAILDGHRHGHRAFGAIVRASGRPDIHATLKNSITRQLSEPLEAALPGPDAALRAHLFCAQFIGLMVALSVYDDEYLQTAPAESIIARYGEALQRTLAPQHP